MNDASTMTQARAMAAGVAGAAASASAAAGGGSDQLAVGGTRRNQLAPAPHDLFDIYGSAAAEPTDNVAPPRGGRARRAVAAAHLHRGAPYIALTFSFTFPVVEHYWLENQLINITGYY